jgi:hypothetical protein
MRVDFALVVQFYIDSGGRVDHMVRPQLINFFFVINIFIYRNYYYKLYVEDNNYLCWSRTL